MAIVPMKHIEIVALHRDAKKVVEMLQREGVVDLSEPEEELDLESGLVQISTASSLAQLDRSLESVQTAIAAVVEYARSKTSILDSLSGRAEWTLDQFATQANQIDQYMKIVYDIEASLRVIEKEAPAIVHATHQLDHLLPWESLDIPMMYEGTSRVACRIGSIQGSHSQASLHEALEKAHMDAHPETEDSAPLHLPDYEAVLVSVSAELTCLCIFCHRSDLDRMDDLLRKISFILPSDPTRHPPRNRIARYRKRIEDAKDAIAAARAQIALYEPHLPELRFLSDYLRMRRDKYEALERLSFSSKTVIIKGFLPAQSAEQLIAKLEKKYTVSIALRDPYEEEAVPGEFDNNAFVAPVEDIVMSFSPPTVRDIDPNPVMSFFYYLFFGMMLSDAGYGLIMALGTLFVIVRLKPEGATRQNMFKFMYCGISSVGWGLLFGSFFGDAIQAVSLAFFNADVSFQPLWYNPVEKPLELLIFSLILGFIHLMAGLVLKFVNMWRNGDKLGALFDVGSWWVVFSGLILIIIETAFSTGMGLNRIGGWLAIGGAVVLVCTQGRASPSLPGKILGGIGSLYDISGYFSDTLSYSRLMALALVTGIVGQVFNTIGTVIGTGIVRILIFIPVFLFGHAVNLGISALGAYVHTNRLQYVEFFSKFYEGGGKAFAPFSTRTKHFKFKEDN